MRDLAAMRKTMGSPRKAPEGLDAIAAIRVQHKPMGTVAVEEAPPEQQSGNDKVAAWLGMGDGGGGGCGDGDGPSLGAGSDGSVTKEGLRNQRAQEGWCAAWPRAAPPP
jgi:hypothetical protein